MTNTKKIRNILDGYRHRPLSDQEKYLFACECARRALDRAVSSGECDNSGVLLATIDGTESFANGIGGDLPNIDKIRKAIMDIDSSVVLDGKEYSSKSVLPAINANGNMTPYLLALLSAYSVADCDAGRSADCSSYWARRLPGIDVAFDDNEIKWQSERLAEIINREPIANI